MTSDPRPIDISGMPDLVRIAEEVTASKKPRILRRHKKAVAILMPVEGWPALTKKQAIEETLALAGSWSDLDWDTMEEELDRIRHESKPTPPFRL
jgi:hypothetical protein